MKNNWKEGFAEGGAGWDDPISLIEKTLADQRKQIAEENQVQMSGDGVYAKIGEKIYKLNESQSGNMWNELTSALNVVEKKHD